MVGFLCPGLCWPASPSLAQWHPYFYRGRWARLGRNGHTGQMGEAWQPYSNWQQLATDSGRGLAQLCLEMPLTEQGTLYMQSRPSATKLWPHTARRYTGVLLLNCDSSNLMAVRARIKIDGNSSSVHSKLTQSKGHGKFQCNSCIVTGSYTLQCHMVEVKSRKGSTSAPW